MPALLTFTSDEIAAIRKEGVEEGRAAALNELLTWLQDKYLGPDRPDRGSPEAQAILTLTRELVRQFRSGE